jgi:putative transposase
MRFVFVEEYREEYPITVMCRVLEISTSGYYAWRSRATSGRSTRREALCFAIRSAFAESRETYGSPRVHVELISRGIDCCVNTVANLMKQMGLRSKTRKTYRPRTTDSKHAHRIARNVLDREFERTSPNEAWVVDITYVPTDEGWLYLAVVLDLFSRRVIGWSMADHLRTQLALDALTMAIGQRSSADFQRLIHHSDRGVQYASDAYQAMLKRHGLTGSMSRTGNCWDNAVVESFFGTLKGELVNHERYETRDEARSSIFDYIEVFYNRKRRHSALGYVSPVEYERQTA